jgi:hypothetical protein
MSRPELTPPDIGELVGLHAEAMVTGDLADLYQRLTRLRHTGVSYATLSKALGVLPAAVKAMIRHGQLASR